MKISNNQSRGSNCPAVLIKVEPIKIQPFYYWYRFTWNNICI